MLYLILMFHRKIFTKNLDVIELAKLDVYQTLAASPGTLNRTVLRTEGALDLGLLKKRSFLPGRSDAWHGRVTVSLFHVVSDSSTVEAYCTG